MLTFSCGLEKFSYLCVSWVVHPESFPGSPLLPRFSSQTHLRNTFLQLFFVRAYVVISMQSYLTTSHQYLLKGRIINMVFSAKALHLGYWTLIIHCFLHKTPLPYGHQKCPRAEHLCGALLDLFRKQDGKTTTTSRIACSLGLDVNEGNPPGLGAAAPAASRNTGPRARLCWGQGKYFARLQRGRGQDPERAAPIKSLTFIFIYTYSTQVARHCFKYWYPSILNIRFC